MPTWTSCSVLAVSHRLDGFLRPDLRAEAFGSWSRGLVASRCRSWGSPRFYCARPAPPFPVCRSAAFPATRFVPLEEFPSPAAAPCHHGRCPLAVPPDASSRFWETRCQVLPSTRICALDADFEALLRLRVRSVFAPLPVRHALSFRWALFPFKVPSTWKSTLPSATVATGGLVRGAFDTSSAPHPSGPRRSGVATVRRGCRDLRAEACRPAPGSPRRRSVGEQARFGAPKCTTRALDSGNVCAEAPTVGSRAGRNRRGEPRRPDPSAVHRGSRNEPDFHPEPDRSRVSGNTAAMSPSLRASAAGVYPEPKFTTLARRGPSWG